MRFRFDTLQADLEWLGHWAGFRHAFNSAVSETDPEKRVVHKTTCYKHLEMMGRIRRGETNFGSVSHYPVGWIFSAAAVPAEEIPVFAPVTVKAARLVSH